MATMLDAAVENEAMAQLLYREARRTTSKEREGGSYLRARSASCKLSSGRACRLQPSVQHRSKRFGYAVLRIARLPSIIGQGRRPSVGVIARVVWFERDIDRPFNLGPASLHSGAEPDEQAQINLSSPYQPPRPCHVLSSASVAGSEDIILCYCGSRCRAFDVAFGSISNTPPYSLHLDKTVNERSTVSRARARRYTVPREPSATRATVPDLCR
jgi:hypothetical protein